MKKKFFILISICFILVFAFCPILSGCSLEDDDSDNNGTNIIYNDVDMGTAFSLEGVEITITDYVIKYYALSGSYGAGDNKVWVIANAKLYNNSTKTINLENITDKLIYTTEANEEAIYNSKWFNNNNWVNAHETIEAFETIEAMFMYQIPAGIAPKLSGYDYSVGGKYSATSTKNIGFEIRFAKNSKSATECYVFKL